MILSLLVGIGIASYVMSDRFANSEELVIHTHQVISLLKEVSAELSEAENGRRGYVLIGDSTLLIEYDVGLRTIPERLNELKSLTADSAQQQRRLSELDPLVSEQMKILTQSVELQKRDPSARDEQLQYTRKGVVLDDKIRTLLGAMEEEENRLLGLRSSLSASKQHRATMILVLAFFLASMVLVSLFLVMSSEVARRARAETVAKENEEKYRLLVSGVQDHAIIRLDLDGRIITWNQGAQRLFGYTSLEILGEPFARLYQTCEKDTPIRHLKTTLDEGHINDECEQMRKDGSVFWATADLTLLRNEEGQPRGYAVITRDITERKQQREQIQQREAQLNAFFTNAPVGLAVLDKNLRFQRINRPFAELNGLVPGEQVGEPIADVVADLGLQIEPLLRRVAQTGESVLNQEIRGPSPAAPNASGWWLKSFFPITREGDQVSQIGAIVQDITVLKRAENSVRTLSGRLLQIRDDERRRLARDLHDSLGQTLTAVKMNLSYVGRNTSGLDERGSNAVVESQELVDNALKEVRTLSHLLHPPMLDDVGLVPAIRWYTNGFAQRSGIQVELELPANLRRLPTELETAVFRVVQESLTNVHRHSGSTTATVRLNTEDESLHLYVIDLGRGIPPDKLAFRLDGAMIGVGLLGMRERLRQLGGKLEISADSSGTRIHVIIPLSGVA
ncbi:MAG TPA: PAS domain S-box protein [Candidatus Angelobacter sp.]|nr:PAS domain S-box protein [Candidatus Angelobacter sp.]